MEFGYKTGECERFCAVHGRYVAKYMERGSFRCYSQCPECEEEDKVGEKDKWNDALLSRWRDSNVRPKFFGMKPEAYVATTDSQRRARKLVEDLASGGGRSLVLCGRNGTGKTMLASIAVMFRGGMICKMYEIVVRIKASYSPGATETEMGILKDLARQPLLAIDEVGKQFGSVSELNWLSYVMDERYESGLPTVLVSNLTPKTGLEGYLGQDVMSRLAETADIVVLDCEDFRMKGVDKIK